MTRPVLFARLVRAASGALLLGAVMGCRPSPAGSRSEPGAIESDLETLCRRVADRSVSAWSQPVFFSPEVLALAVEIDGGSTSARCEMGKLMREHRVAACRDTGRDLRRSCAGG